MTWIKVRVKGMKTMMMDNEKSYADNHNVKNRNEYNIVSGRIM